MSTEGERQQERRSVACGCGVLRGWVRRVNDLECQPAAARDGKRAMPIAEQDVGRESHERRRR